MNWQTLLIAFWVIAPVAVLMHWLPLMRKPYFFSVGVPAGFAKSAAAQPILLRYRSGNIVMAIVEFALVLYGLEFKQPLLILAGASIYAIAIFILQRQAQTQAMPFRVETSSNIRAASLAADEPVSWWMYVVAFAPYLILGAAALYVAMHYSELPERVPVHYGVSGQPDRWQPRSTRSVFGIFVIGAAVTLLVSSTVLLMIFGARRGAYQSSYQNRFLRANLLTMAGVGCGTSLLISGIGLMPLRGIPDVFTPPFWIVNVVSMALIMMSLYPVLVFSSAPEESDSTPDQYWKGAFYSNPDDPALVVPKRLGIGFTLNFAHPTTRYLFPALILVLFGAMIYVVR